MEKRRKGLKDACSYTDMKIKKGGIKDMQEEKEEIECLCEEES